MKSSWSLTILLLVSGADSNFADTVELNGITCLFGENMAFLVLHQPAQNKPVSFALSEGESRFGVKLLAVDAANGRAEIEQAGGIFSLRVGFAPDLALPAARLTTSGQSPAANPFTPEEQSAIERFLNEDPDAQRIKLGNPVVKVAYVGAPLPPASGNASGSSSAGSPASGSGDPAATAGTAGQGTAVSDGSAGGSAGNSPASSDAGSTPSVDYTKEYWYKTSLSIEQNRLATADQVISGEMEPLPATPLTPPNTPASLVGPDTFFSNHIPGFVCGGSVDD